MPLVYVLFAVLLFFTYDVASVAAANLRLSPETGIYTTGNTFSVRVLVNTQGQPINAAEGEISFNQSDLSVVSISKVGSLFTLWTREPEFSNSTGKIYFGGGSPSGYTGAAGTIMTITFKAKYAGSSQVSYSSGSILAADGRGTNILSTMQGATYTLQAALSVPPPEYVPPANTPGAPMVTSTTHPNPASWYKSTSAQLAWELPNGITAVRTALDQKELTIPTKTYEEPIREITLSDLSEGVSYFHIQFKNADGWGRVTHYRIATDSEKPVSFALSLADGNDPGNLEQAIRFDVVDQGSGVSHYEIQLDGGERVRFEDPEHTKTYKTARLTPGDHTIVVEAFDHALNSIVGSLHFNIQTFDAPLFTEYPHEVSSDVIPVLRGTTRGNAQVTIDLTKIGAQTQTYVVTSDTNGVFTFIPEGRFTEGVYEVTAIATDAFGAQSESSEKIRIAVQKPGLIRLGGIVINFLSVIVPLLALLGLLILTSWYGLHRIQRMRRRIRKEVVEAEQSLAREFASIVAAVKRDVVMLRDVRKGKLTKQEDVLIDGLTENLAVAEKRIKKEIEDIEKLVRR